MAKNAVPGFPENAMAFLKKLKKNNSKEWFEKNRALYESELLEPAQEFVKVFGAELQKIRPNIQAIPKIDKSIFRLHRDVRFSKDKNPYKTNLGILFWEGPRKKMENSGLYIHLEPGKLAVGNGMHMFAKDQLKIYRDAAADPAMQKELIKAVNKTAKKGYTVEGRNYKQVPRGYYKEMPNVEWLLHDGLYAWHTCEDMDLIGDGKLIPYTKKLFKDTIAIHEWLLSVKGLV